MNEIESIKVSVIVPVYNVAPYLRQCMDSIVGQTLREIEIICIDDGSTDDSPAILREYAALDARVTILPQENQGVSAARNHGLSVAQGEYVIFWDSDDWFELDALELLYSIASERRADMVICNAQDFDNSTGLDLGHNYIRKPYPETDVFCAKDCPDRIFDISGMNSWNRLVRRQLLLENDIRYPALPLIEDSVVTMLEMLLAERIALCTKRLIHYRVNRPGSLMMDYSRRANGMIDGCTQCYRQLSARGLLDDEMILRSFLDKIAGLYLYTMPLYADFEQYKEYYRKMLCSTDSLLQKWDPSWESMPDAAKYLEAKEIAPEEYLFRQVQQMMQLDKERRTRIRDLERENRKLSRDLEKILSSETYKAARFLSAPMRAIKKLTASAKEEG